jgi:response regulator of citrate/malate metabolism
MIRVLIVDDDFMVARIHGSLVERVSGFQVVGEAHTGVDALAAVERLRPDLVLLDIYLPDMSGLQVMRKLREPERPQVDIMAVTAAKDVETLRAAMHSGVVHYLIKPFSFETLRERLETYSALQTRLERLTEAEQADVDRLYSMLRARSGGRLPKGISAPTLESVLAILREADREVSAAEVADQAGISRGTARRYLEHLAAGGLAELDLRYGTTGRPEHRYRWIGEIPTANHG